MNEQIFVPPAMQDDKNTIFQMRFPQKLWYLLNMRTDAILWGGTGRTILLNYRTLHNYLQCDNSIFKTTNISSFVRQLNLYGFRKVTSHLQDPLCNSSNPYMHEYVHDHFQYGRLELLNKITRKALPIRKHCRSSSKMVFESGELAELPSTPLQKARRALHAALRKAAQDLINSSSKQFCNLKFECDEVPEEFVEDEENVEFEPSFWTIPKPPIKEASLTQPPPPPAAEVVPPEPAPEPSPEDISQPSYEQPPQDLMSFNDVDEPQSNNDSFPSQFLSMPDLDAEPTEDNSGVELLAEFDIYHDADQGIAQPTVEKNNDKSLNCVLPFVSNDQSDDVTMDQNNNGMSDHYQDGEWDQMFSDMLTAKGPSQECGSELKELYSQISRTIDLLNS